jgi:hypothetical protein
LHFNDSKIELGGNRDRHANIGEGTIGAKGLAPLVGHPKIRDLPLLLEVPGDGEGPRAEDVAVAKKVVAAGIRLYDGGSSRQLSTPRMSAKPAATSGAKPSHKTPTSKMDPPNKKAVKKVTKKVTKKAVKKVTKKVTKKAVKKSPSKPKPPQRLAAKKVTKVNKKSTTKKSPKKN